MRRRRSGGRALIGQRARRWVAMDVSNSARRVSSVSIEVEIPFSSLSSSAHARVTRIVPYPLARGFALPARGPISSRSRTNLLRPSVDEVEVDGVTMELTWTDDGREQRSCPIRKGNRGDVDKLTPDATA